MERELESIADPFEETVLRELRKVPLISRSVMKLGECWRICAQPPAFRAAPQRAHCQRHLERHGVTNQTVYRLLRRYWQEACAGMPSCRTMSTRAPVARQKAEPGQAGQAQSGDGGERGNVTPDIERIFRRVIEERLLRKNIRPFLMPTPPG